MSAAPILFCNVAWMRRFAGRNANDPPLGGGRFVRDEGYAHEECNFVACDDGYVYGHFETYKGRSDRQIVLERLGADTSAGFLDDVDIVWTAPSRGTGSRTVVGWYRHARLYRQRQFFGGHYPSRQHRNAGIDTYRVRARPGDAFLLPEEERTLALAALIRRGELRAAGLLR